jgi:hypothetical protein
MSIAKTFREYIPAGVKSEYKAMKRLNNASHLPDGVLESNILRPLYSVAMAS